MNMTVRANRLHLTGNPFVDTGLAVIAALGNLDSIESLTIHHVESTYGDGTQLSSWNSKLKSFSQVFGTNNPLFQTAYGFKKGKGSSELNDRIYRETLQRFLSRIRGGSGPQFRCEACGDLSRFDFAGACLDALTTNGQQAAGDKWVGRDWFPLAGSMGSDAQALPAASRPVHLCARCLFAVHYLPLGVMLIDGRLAVFQSTSCDFWYELVRNIVSVVKARIHAGNYETLGAKDGSRSFATRLLDLFEQLQRSKQFSFLPPSTALEVSRFSNSNPPSCDRTEIPNSALVFLGEAVGHGLRGEIQNLLQREQGTSASLLNCVLERKDYPVLYPRAGWQGCSPKLFALYQTLVCGRTTAALAFACALAKESAKQFSQKDLERLKRDMQQSELSVQSQLRAMIARMVSRKEFTLDHYLNLFPVTEDSRGIKVESHGWKVVGFYLNRTGNIDSLEVCQDAKVQPCSKSTVVRYYAAQIMQSYVAERGKDRFRSDVVDRIPRGEIRAEWLRGQFARLAECIPGFSYAAWQEFCVDDTGNLFVSELLFQVRLLWNQWVAEENWNPEVEAPVLPQASDLPREIEEKLRFIFSEYAKLRGLKRFRANVLVQLRKREIALEWFRRQLTAQRNSVPQWKPLTQSEWEDYLVDEQGYSAVRERLFQMHLMLANLYREASNLRKEDGA